MNRITAPGCISLLLILAGPALAAEYPAGDPVIANGLHATGDNVNGFAEGDWIPDLTITFDLEKEDGSFRTSGSFMPMVASDGPHYGDNVKLGGEGKYRLTFHIAPPGAHTHFGRHVDKETGVAEWFAPFDATYEFIYAGTGKKGAY